MSANNQLAIPRAGRILHERGIWYAPDFGTNAGAVIAGFDTGAGRGLTPQDAACALASERLDAAGARSGSTRIVEH